MAVRRNKSAYNAVLQVAAVLREANFEALLAGGCVRDMLMGVEPKDYDLATSASPRQVTALFPRALQVGAAFGVVVVQFRGYQIEIATFRTDADYGDGRHPDRVEFTDAEHDAARRDFTINGMFMDPQSQQVIDYVGGQKDLKNRIVRAIGQPQQRFKEDRLRLLRAVRFAATLDFELEVETSAAVLKNSAQLIEVSRERIRDEFIKVLESPQRHRGLVLLNEHRLLPGILGGLGTAIVDDVVLAAIDSLPPNAEWELALAVFLASRGVGNVRVVSALRSHLRLSREWVRRLHFLLDNQQSLVQPEMMRQSELRKLIGEPQFENLVHFHQALASGRGEPTDFIDRLRTRCSSWSAASATPPPLINGEDVMALGVPAGPSLGALLAEAYNLQLDEQLHTKIETLEWIQSEIDKTTN